MRICDLDLTIKDTALEPRIEQLYSELDARGIRFRPHCWLSDDWFSPDGVPGIAIPFYMAHPRLMRLERRKMLEVEGGTREWCMKILRHEAGHAVDTAYRLRRRRRWREVFGKASLPYPNYYKPKPYSRSFVLHLDTWYAQSHPTEDFAETFAVWLRPRSRWRSDYQDWPAIKKLQYVDELVPEIAEQKVKVVSREHVDPLRTIRKTLGEHYQAKRDHYGIGCPTFYDQELLKLFSSSKQYAKRPSAASFLRRIRRNLRREVAHWTGEYQYTIDQVLDEMISRCKELDLHLTKAERETERESLVMVTVQTMNFLQSGHHRFAV